MARMQFYEAKVADVLRCSQRDEEFIGVFQEYLNTFLSFFGRRKLMQLQKYSPAGASLCYYLLTTLSNLQTLGEEYTGILRIKDKTIPKKWAQILWLALHIGGEPIVTSLLNKWTFSIKSSTSLTANAKQTILQIITFLKENKHILIRLHQSIFYMNGKYYYISNRLVGIQYVLVRKWLQDDSSTYSFKLLGKLSFVYLVFKLIEAYRFNQHIEFVNSSSSEEDFLLKSNNGCALCGSNRTNTCSTPCGHLFCWSCIYESVSYQQNCPVCREVTKPSRIVYLQNYC